MCYIGYSSFYKDGWSFLYGQPVPRFAGLIIMSFGIGLVFFSSYRVIKLFKENKSH